MAFLYVITALSLILIYHIHMAKLSTKLLQDMKCAYYVILRRVRVTIVAMNNQGMLRSLSVCL
jgi:hypothetical protein